MMRHLPIFLDTTSASIVLVGDGKGAVQRLRLLQNTAGSILVLAEKPCEQLAAMAAEHDRTRLESRPFNEKDLLARLIFLAPETAEQRKQAARVAALARENGIPVNAIDDKSLCDFYVPAMVDRSPVVVAIGTEGTAPLLARNIKAELERLLPHHLGRLAEFAGKLRGTVAARLPHSGRRHFWQRFFDAVTPDSNLSDTAEAILQDMQPSSLPADSVTEIFCPPNAEDLPLKHHRQLLQADVVIYDAGISQEILNLVRKDAEFISATQPHDNKHGKVVRLLNPVPVSTSPYQHTEQAA